MIEKAPELSGIKKIAVLRANALGDFIFVLPALQALKGTFPDAEIVYFGNKWHKEFLSGRPSPVNRVEVVPKCHGIPLEADRVQDQAEVDDFFSSMKDERFDIAFQLHGGGRHSNPFVLNLGARLTVGLRSPDALPLDINVPYFLFQNEILRYMEVVGRVGARTNSYEPQLSIIPSDFVELNEVFPDIKKPYIVLHPGASSIHRQWPAERFARIGDFLVESGFDVYVTGTQSEKEIVTSVISAMNLEAKNLCNKISLKALSALLFGADLLVSNDTGPLHLARALNVKTVGIYLGYNMITAGPVTVTKHRTCIGWRNNCPLCGTSWKEEDFNKPPGKCKHNISLLDDVTEAEVKDAILGLIADELKEVKKSIFRANQIAN